MSGVQIGNLIFLILLLLFLGSWFIHNKQKLSKTLTQAAIWFFIFLLVVVGYGLWSDQARNLNGRATVIADAGRVVVPQSADGHYYLTLQINEKPVDFVVDTGATQMVLSQQDADRVGLDPKGLAYVGTASTANGIVSTAYVYLDSVALGDIRDRQVPAVVNRGEMSGSLLGMSYLDYWDTITFGNGQMVLER